MPYDVTEAISKYLPPDVITVEPLEFDWDEAVNAVVFTSRFDATSFSAWETSLSEHYMSVLGKGPRMKVESDSELGCIAFRINLDPANLPEGTISVDISVAWRGLEESVENLNAWVGSSLLEDMVEKDKPAMAGLIRIRPEVP